MITAYDLVDTWSTNPLSVKCCLSVGQVSKGMLIKCWLRWQLRVLIVEGWILIEGMNRHSTVYAFSTHNNLLLLLFVMSLTKSRRSDIFDAKVVCTDLLVVLVIHVVHVSLIIFSSESDCQHITFCVSLDICCYNCVCIIFFVLFD